jgi:hypothetical protein
MRKSDWTFTKIMATMFGAAVGVILVGKLFGDKPTIAEVAFIAAALGIAEGFDCVVAAIRSVGGWAE